MLSRMKGPALPVSLSPMNSLLSCPQGVAGWLCRQVIPCSHSHPSPENKKALLLLAGLFVLISAWRCPTFTWQLPHYHRRKAFSLLSSRWIQVVPTRYSHQAKPV